MVFSPREWNILITIDGGKASLYTGSEHRRKHSMVKVTISTEEKDVFLDVQKQGKGGRWVSQGVKRLAGSMDVTIGAGLRIGIAEAPRSVLQTSPEVSKEKDIG